MPFKPLKPGVMLMRHLRLPTKLVALALVLIVPLFLTSLFLLGRLNAEIRVTQTALQGAALVQTIGHTVREVQQHRGQTNLLLSGDSAAPQALDQIRQRLGTEIAALDSAMAQQPAFALQAEWEPVKTQIQALTQDDERDAEKAFARHSEAIQALRQLNYTAAERSSLLFDPVPGSYFLMNLVVSHTPAWSELLGQIRGLGAGQLARPEPSVAGLLPVKALVSVARERTQALEAQQRFLAQNGLGELAQDPAIAQVRQFLDRAQGALSNPGSVGAAAYFAAGTEAIAAVNAYELRLHKGLSTVLGERLSASLWQRNLTLASAVLGVSLVGYLMLCFYFSFVIDFRRVIRAMTETATGNLRMRLAAEGSDELAELTRLLERMTANLSMMVAEVRSNSALVAHSGQSLALGNRELADRTEQQAANLEQTVSSVQELSATVHQNAQTAGDSDSQAARVRDVAESGGQAMTDAVASVTEIQQGAQQMNDIIGVIDSLAFQTNILALNAAVEAARAGEQGRGFAVVANEVRNLAQRSAASAREIRALIQTSSGQVEASVKRMRVAGDNMAQIIAGVRGVATNMSLISAASGEQSTGLVQISSAVGQLEQITQRNAQMVERAVQQANQLSARADGLSRAVASFKLQQGTAEEAVELIERVLAHRQTVGRDRFVQTVTQPESGFHDRDMYVFALDAQGVYRAFAGKPEKVGTSVKDIPGVDGEALLASIVAQAEIETGWVEYDIVNPQTGKVQTKMSYVTKVDNLYLGCGVYKSALLSVGA